MNYKEALMELEHYDKEHGSYFDRGSADSYYGRDRQPHRGGVGGMSGPRIEAVLAEDIEALKIDPSWRPDEVLKYVAKLVRNS